MNLKQVLGVILISTAIFTPLVWGDCYKRIPDETSCNQGNVECKRNCKAHFSCPDQRLTFSGNTLYVSGPGTAYRMNQGVIPTETIDCWVEQTCSALSIIDEKCDDHWALGSGNCETTDETVYCPSCQTSGTATTETRLSVKTNTSCPG